MKAEIICIIDKSGSMQSHASDYIGGFNTFLEAQQAVPGEAKMSLALFSYPHDYTMLYAGVDLAKVKKLTTNEYKPDGGTALYDAIGKTLSRTIARLQGQQPDKIIVAILTDGEENSSTEFGQGDIADMIKGLQDDHGWEFIFLAANQDAFANAGALNIKRGQTMSYEVTQDSILDNYRGMSVTVANLRSK